MEKIPVGNIEYSFGDDGFLKEILLHGRRVAGAEFGRLHLRLADGTLLEPRTFAPPRKWAEPEEGRVVVEFENIRFGEHFRLALRYELYEYGAGFVKAFFCSDMAGINGPALDDLSLRFAFETAAYPQKRWGITPRPREFSGAAIQAMSRGRYLDTKEFRHADGEIAASVSLDVKDDAGVASYFEIFVEGQNAVNGSADDNYTDARFDADGNIFCTEFGFIRERPCRQKTMQLFQWRNTWGWILKNADVSRRKPPMHMAHFFDNYANYPSDASIDRMGAAGVDVLVLHECWRFDLQNDGFPFNGDELARVIATAHKNDIRVMLYIRGSEISSVETACDWFGRWLKKDYDGLYMDFGGPFHVGNADESYPGNRVALNAYTRYMKALRARVGEDGMIYGHTGPSFSALFYATGECDGFCSGECEAGKMTQSREVHEYYSKAAVSPGTMWVGAFPEYSSAKMRPFMAATGQTPHSPLGQQFKSSSLSHPSEIGLNDTAFRPLWKLYRLLRGERNLSVYNDYNSVGVFNDASADCGRYMMISTDNSRGLLIISNFANVPREYEVSVNLAKRPKSAAWRMLPTECAPGKAEKVSGDIFRVKLGAYDLAGIYFDTDEVRAAKVLADFETPYLELSENNKQHLALVEAQKSARTAAETPFLRVFVDPMDFSYEYSLNYDLFFNAFALEDNGKIIGWISKNGFVKDEPKEDAYIWPGDTSPWIDLRDVLAPGEHNLTLRSVHYGEPFYNFETALLNSEPKDDGARKIIFINELEPLRELLNFSVRI